MAPTPASSSKKQLRSDDDKIFLVGKCESEILGAKLPSMKQVLQLFFHKTRMENISAKDSMKYTIGAALQFWEKAKIPTLAEKNCIKKLEKLYEEWKSLQKNKNSPYGKHRRNEKEFSEKIENYIFDIAAPDALETMKIQEDRDFLLLQRQPGRPESMSGIDITLARKEERKAIRLEGEKKRKEKYQERMAASGIAQISSMFCVVFSYKYLTSMSILRSSGCIGYRCPTRHRSRRSGNGLFSRRCRY